MNTQNTIRRILGFLTAVLWLMLHSAIATAAPTYSGAIVPVANSRFEMPKLLPNAWRFTVPGWQPLSDSTVAGVWRPWKQFSKHAGIDGQNMMFIDIGGVGQQLPATLQPATDYTFSAKWGQRLDVMLGAVALQFVAGDQVLATCAPPYGPGPGNVAGITLLYHSDAANPAAGQPLAIRIVNRNDVALPGLYVNPTWGTQVDVADVRVTSKAHSRAPARHGSECTMSMKEAKHRHDDDDWGDAADAAANAADSATPAAVALMNPNFEDPNYLLPGGVSDYVPGWALADGSQAGVVRILPGVFSGNAPIQGSNILWINSGSVSQELPIRLQAMADYSFSVNWGHRLDVVNNAALALQFVAGGQVIASCAPPAGPDPGQWARVTVVYHSDGSSLAVGQPLTIQIVKLPQDITETQVDIDSAEVTFADRTGTPSSVITNAQECTLTTFQ